MQNFEFWARVEFTAGVSTVAAPNGFFTRDNKSAKLGIRCFYKSEPYIFTNAHSLSWFAKNSDGVTRSDSGTVTVGTNEAYAELPEAALVTGPITVALRLEDSPMKLVAAVFTGYVHETSTEHEEIPPWNPVPDIQQLMALIGQMETVVDEAQEVTQEVSEHFPDTGRFVVGTGSTVSSDNSASIGWGNAVTGPSAQALGSHTIANHAGQHVFGAYNVADPSENGAEYRGNYIEIVGNGLTDESRSNARTLDWNGNEVLAGSLTIGGDEQLTKALLQTMKGLDGRIGNTTMGTTATTVTGAIAEHEDDLDVLKSAFVNDTTQITGCKPLVFQKGQYRVYADNTVSDISSPVTGTTTADRMVCAKIACTPGDVFTIRARGKASSAAAYGFFDTEFHGIARNGVNVLYDGTVTAPENAAWLAINNDVVDNPSDYFAYKGNSLASIAYKYLGVIGSETDLDDITGQAVYRWTSTNRPNNSPTFYAGIVYCSGGSGSFYQVAINQQLKVFVRTASNGVWQDWIRLTDSSEIDGVTDAVETLSRQLTETNETVADNNNNVKTAFAGVTNCDLMEFKTGSYKTPSTPPTGKTISYNDGSTGVVCAIMPCSEGDVFTVRAEGTAGTSRGWMFADEDMVCLSAALANAHIDGTITAPANAAYLCINNNTSKLADGYYAFKGRNNADISYTLDGNTWGRANVKALIRHILAIKWTPTGQMPMGSNSYYDLIEQTGIPYSSVRDADKAVGSNVSIHTFMTAVRDPNSVLYTRKSNTSNADTYYGTVCSGLCNYAYGIGLNLTNNYLGESDWFETIPMQSIEVGDMLYKNGHVAIISDLTKDKYGRIETVDVSEEWGDSETPNGRVVHYNSWSAFLNARPQSQYIARRFKKIGGVEYASIPYVLNFDEEPQEIVYPDIQCDHGDAAVFVTGDDVRINVIDAKDYTSITVTKDGTTVTTKNAIQPFTLENVQAGMYTITASGGDSTSVSTFYVVDCTGAFNAVTGELTFSSSNATPVLANVYNLPIVDGKYALTCKPIPLNDEDRARGSINVLSYMDNEYQYAKVTFATPYGTVDWYSETHDRWVPIT